MAAASAYNGSEAAKPLLTVEGLSVSFKVGREGLFRKGRLRAVQDVSFTIGERETLGLVGESGSGKSTTGRGILRLVPADSGRVILDDVDLSDLSGRALREKRRNMQMVFQDPYSSLDPSSTIGESIGEPLQAHTQMTASERRDAVEELLGHVGLPGSYIDRYPYEFSGGQRQRLAIARAVALRPQLIVCDEAVSALDVSTQNQVIELLERLSDEFGVSYLFIAHNLAVVRHIAHRTAVMYLGRIVEVGPTARLFEAPAHPYTEALLSAVPVPNPARQRGRERIVLSGDMPNPARPPSGCVFHPRCPYAMPVCSEVAPMPVEVEGGGTVACHLHTEGPKLAGGTVVHLSKKPAAA